MAEFCWRGLELARLVDRARCDGRDGVIEFRGQPPDVDLLQRADLGPIHLAIDTVEVAPLVWIEIDTKRNPASATAEDRIDVAVGSESPFVSRVEIVGSHWRPVRRWQPLNPSRVPGICLNPIALADSREFIDRHTGPFAILTLHHDRIGPDAIVQVPLVMQAVAAALSGNDGPGRRGGPTPHPDNHGVGDLDAITRLECGEDAAHRWFRLRFDGSRLGGFNG